MYTYRRFIPAAWLVEFVELGEMEGDDAVVAEDFRRRFVVDQRLDLVANGFGRVRLAAIGGAA